MTSINNISFDDDEESETEFNPGREQGSDDEASQSGDVAPQRSDRDSATNGNRARASESTAALLGDDADDGEDNGEDDEGEGEDLGEEDEEDEEEEEEDEEDDEDAVVGRPKKRRRRGLNQFIEEEAEVDEDDDELEADEDDIAETGFIQDTHPDDDLGPEADQDDRRHRELDRQRQIEASVDAEAAAARLKERYGRRTAVGLDKGSFVPQNLLMPSVDDPGIWTMKCKPGKEEAIIKDIMKRIVDGQKIGQPLKICSAFERGGPNSSMSGCIFVEAYRQDDVMRAVSGISFCYPNTKEVIPVKQMPDLLRVRKTKELTVGSYVRIKKTGLYAGDLGMIDEVEDNSIEVTVKLVPRLDYGLNDDDKQPLQQKEKRKRAPFAPAVTPANRPPQKLFNENEAKKKHGRFLQVVRGLTNRTFQYKNETYEDGFLIKRFRTNALETVAVHPKLEEITRLAQVAADGSETLDLETLAQSVKQSSAVGSYVPGDEVEVYEGEQRGIVGKIEGVTGGILRIKVSEGELLGQVVEQPMKGVRKRFREGDHVKVIGSSRYAGEVGMVIRIKDDRVTVLTDTSVQEITVFSKDLREAAEAGGSDVKATKFDVQDLVQINATEVGIVIKSDMEAVRILDENSSVTSRLPSQLSKVEIKRNAVATDRNGSEIRVGDTVKESGGEGKSGRILHINRGHLFLHDRTRLENSGLWTTRCMNVVTVASKSSATSAVPDLSKMNPQLNGRNGAAAMPPPQRIGKDRLIGQTIAIRKGPYKGHRGIVKDTTNDNARIELQSKNKTINISKQDLGIVDTKTNTTIDFNTFSHSRGPSFPTRTGGPPSRPPDAYAGGRTPAFDGGRTPAWGAASSRTPAWSGASGNYSGGKTPAWAPASGSQTSYGGGGGATSYGGAGNYGAAGSRTPAAAWSASSKTPYSGDHGYGSSGASGYDAFAAGSRTPAYGAASSRTPAYGAAAPTPAARPFDAPTPGISAPTPGGFENDGSYTAYGGGAPTPGAGFGAGPIDAPTPGFAKGANKEVLAYNRLNAPTPGATAATPFAGGYDAPTPAAGGPRYADDDEDD